jgi:hypothetical protein
VHSRPLTRPHIGDMRRKTRQPAEPEADAPSVKITAVRLVPTIDSTRRSAVSSALAELRASVATCQDPSRPTEKDQAKFRR